MSFYDAGQNFISGQIAASNTGDSSFVRGEFTAPDSTAFIKLSGASASYAPTHTNTAIYSNTITELLDSLDERVSVLENEIGNKITIPYIAPYKVFTVCNDVIASKRGYNRNNAAAIYLDHFFNGLTSEKKIRFNNGQDRYMFNSPILVTDSNETSPAVTYNEGQNVLEKDVVIGITGTDIVDSTFTVKHSSVLNSVTSGVKPRVLCIGDSITYAELATVNDDGHSQNWAYHLMCKELFMKDNIDNGGSGYEVLFLGQYKKQRVMTYKEQQYNVVTHHEGIRGISLSSYLNGNVAAFKSETTGKFSINAWLEKFRTMNDNGDRLTLGDGTGTSINSSNISEIDVCTPTHVLIMLGANGGGTQAQYEELIQIIKTEYPNMIIGMVLSDTAGTYFPSLHPNCNVERMTMWADISAPQGSRHNQQYNLQKMFNQVWGSDEAEQNDIYLLPFFFVQPSAESFSMRETDLPDAIFRLTEDHLYNDAYGWHPSTHINGIGHTNWAYQLYAWLKYTIAKKI